MALKQVLQMQLGVSGCFLALAILLTGCGKEDTPQPDTLSILSISVGGSPLENGAVNIDTSATIRIVFSRAISPEKFNSSLSITETGGIGLQPGIIYKNATTAAEITADFRGDTEYLLRLEEGTFGQNGEVLQNPVSLSFTTIGSGIVTSLPPCLSASADCLRKLVISEGNASGSISYYGSFPPGLENASWENLRTAIFVIHGQNRDADHYFTSMVSAILDLGLEDEILVLSPQFKDPTSASGDDLYWSTSAWREGADASNAAGISAFSVIDAMIAVLADQERFPVLENILLTGHSSGATFVHTYAAAGRAEDLFPGIGFHYVVANSQYFYYPEDVRYDEDAMEFQEVTGCPGYNHWPYGFVNGPPYLEGVPETDIDNHVANRQVLYLLGTADTSTTGTLNTSDCEAVLLGSNRFRRGQNMFALMETYFPGHNNSKLTVPGVGHDNVAMFNSGVFGDWLLSVH